MYILLLWMVLPCSIWAQNRPDLNTVNMNKAMAANSEGDTKGMLKYLKQEVSVNDKNGYAYVYLAYLYAEVFSEYGNALQAVEKALMYLPKKDKEYLYSTYAIQGDVYSSQDEYRKALESYSKLVSLSPKNHFAYEARAEAYFNLKEYDLSDKDYRKSLSLDKSSLTAYKGLGRNALRQDKYKEALEYFDYVLKYDPEDGYAYAFKAELYLHTGEKEEAVDNMVKALEADHNQKAQTDLYEMADSAYAPLVSRLKVQKSKEPNNAYWPYLLGYVSEHVKKYDKAVEYYKDAYAVDPDGIFQYEIATCYYDLGYYRYALECINNAIESDTSDVDYRAYRSHIYDAMGNFKEAVADVSWCIERKPESYYYHYLRGHMQDYADNKDSALEDYTTSITLNPKHAYLYMTRGRLYLKMENPEAARKDFLKAVELDTDMTEMNCAFYGYFYLGDSAKALQYLDTLLKYKPDENYNAACLHSLMGNKKEALDYLSKAFEKDAYRNFNHIERDKDLDNIRQMEEFKQLVKKYKDLYEQELRPIEEALDHRVEQTVEIPFNRRNGVTEVQCAVNGLSLYFVFDTGAGDVTISMVEASFMVKNGYLSEKDVIGKQNYMTASGEIAEGTTINLNKVEIGGLTLNNVRATVVKSQKAPLLLGQSVLSRLGKIEIDNERRVLKITYKEEVSGK